MSLNACRYSIKVFPFNRRLPSTDNFAYLRKFDLSGFIRFPSLPSPERCLIRAGLLPNISAIFNDNGIITIVGDTRPSCFHSRYPSPDSRQYMSIEIQYILNVFVLNIKNYNFFIKV